MNDNDRTRCPHCHSELESSDAGTDFWVRCGGCGRRVMPRSWSRIVNDPEPAALFRPTAKDRMNSNAGMRIRPVRYEAKPSRRISRNRMVALLIPAVVASASVCWFVSSFYTTTDVLLSGFMGMLLAIFIVFVPSLLVAVGTGTITLAFYGATFGFGGDELERGAIYFFIGFVLAGFVQIVNTYLAKYPVDGPIPASSPDVVSVAAPAAQSGANASG
jgi:hypothetical protein